MHISSALVNARQESAVGKVAATGCMVQVPSQVGVRDFNFSKPVCTVPGAHLASFAMGPALFPADKVARGMA